MSMNKLTTRGVTLRAMEDADLAQIFDLYRVVFGPDNAVQFRARWEWAHEQGCIPAAGSRWVAADGDKIVGFLAAMPLPYSIGGERVIAHTPCDYMVHPDYRFHGIKLMKQFFDSHPNCVTCDDIPATIKVTQWLGAQTVGPVATYLKLLDCRALNKAKHFSALPGASLRIGTYALRGLDRLLFVGFSNIRVEPAEAFDERFDAFFERTAQATPATLAKEPAFLRWRYGDKSPQSGCEIVTANADGQMVGYAVLYLARLPRPTGYILDMQTLPGAGNQVTTELLGYAARRFRQRGALSMKYHALASPFAPPEGLMRRLGFVPVNQGRRLLMVKFADPNLAKVANQVSSWSYSFGDAEVSHSLA